VTLSANQQPARFDVDGVGPVYVTGVASGLAQWQTHRLPSDHTREFEADNAQVSAQEFLCARLGRARAALLNQSTLLCMTTALIVWFLQYTF
jgi:hypothetical protein